MAEVTKLTTFKDVVSVPSFITYVKTTAADEIVFPEHGVASAILTTNGTLEAWAYKKATIANAVTSQTAGTIVLNAADSAKFAQLGYVWNVTKDEIVLVASVSSTTVNVRRALFGTAQTVWAINDVCVLLKVLVTDSTGSHTGKGIGEYIPMPDFGIGQAVVEV